MKSSRPRWTKEEEAILREHGAHMLSYQIRDKFMPYRSYKVIQRKCMRLGIRKTYTARVSDTVRFTEDDKEKFCKLYHELENKELARIYDVNPVTIERQARKWLLPRKCKKYKDINQNFTQRQIEIIEGTLLGDATLTKIYGNYNSRLFLKHGLPQEEYIKWKYEELKPFSTNLKYNKSFSPLTINKKIVGRNTSRPLTSVSCQTIAHPYLTELEKKWYLRDDQGNYLLKDEHRIKIIPKDLVLTPLSLAIWFFDDGSHGLNYCKKNKRYEYSLRLFTLSFTKDECDFLCTLLNNLNINAYTKFHADNQYSIFINRSSYKTFIDTVSPHLPHKSLFYKVDLKGYNFNENKRIEKENRFLPFEDARSFACKLGIPSVRDWYKYRKSGDRPYNIPACPSIIYQKEWKGWDYWLGNEFLSFEEARSFAKTLNLKSKKSWHDYARINKQEHNIPIQPYHVYKSEWKGWSDWLGVDQ